MSSIDAQIKALQLKKKKIDYVSYVVDLLKNDTKCIDFKDVKDEVVKKITPFLKELTEAIEKDAEVRPAEKMFTDKQVDILKSVADTIANKPLKVEKTETIPVKNEAFSKEETSIKPTPPPAMSHNDKINFAMNNRHLADKRVQVLNDQNAQIFGKVVGLDAPFVIVKTETGPTIQVPIEKVVPS